MVNFAEGQILQQFKSTIDQEKIYALIRINGHCETVEVGSRRFEDWLRFAYHQTTRLILQDASYRRAIDMIRTQALFSDTQSDTLHNRVAMVNNEIYYDLATNDWNLVKISNQGVEIVAMNSQTPFFERHQHQRQQIRYVVDRNKDSLEELVQLLRIQPQFKQISKFM